jgi:hypothetical protein
MILSTGGYNNACWLVQWYTAAKLNNWKQSSITGPRDYWHNFQKLDMPRAIYLQR